MSLVFQSGPPAVRAFAHSKHHLLRRPNKNCSSLESNETKTKTRTMDTNEPRIGPRIFMRYNHHVNGFPIMACPPLLHVSITLFATTDTPKSDH